MQYDIDYSKCACRNFPTEWWYPSTSGRRDYYSVKAIEVCGTCDQQEPCLMYALRHETHGIWGGMREADRELERRKRNITLTPQALSAMSMTTARTVKRLNKEATL